MPEKIRFIVPPGSFRKCLRRSSSFVSRARKRPPCGGLEREASAASGQARLPPRSWRRDQAQEWRPEVIDSRVERSGATVKAAELPLHQVQNLAHELVQALVAERPRVELLELAVDALLLPHVEEVLALPLLVLLQTPNELEPRVDGADDLAVALRDLRAELVDLRVPRHVETPYRPSSLTPCRPGRRGHIARRDGDYHRARGRRADGRERRGPGGRPFRIRWGAGRGLADRARRAFSRRASRLRPRDACAL